MSCTKEEIERKRLAAIQKRLSKSNVQSTPSLNSSNGPTSSYYNHAINSPNKPYPSIPNTSQRSFHPYAKPETNITNDNPTKVVTGTIYLMSEERFEVNPSEFCIPLINIFKTIPSRSYDPSTKLWNFAVDDYQMLMNKVASLAPHVVLGTLPSYVLKILKDPVLDPNKVDLSPIESTLRNKLMPFQQEGVRFGIAKRGRCMIADDMGLGKTFQALAITSYYRHNWPLLIVTTSSMRETWQSKIHELLPSTPMMNIVSLTSQKDVPQTADRQTEVVITSYKITTMHAQLLTDKKFGVVILDESHYLKSPKARCTIALTAICKSASRVILLSGSPALSRPSELYTQLRFIHPDLFSNFTEYGKRYCAGKLTNFGWDMTGQSNLAELQILLQRKFLIRRTKDQVLTKLEAKVREAVLLDQSLLQFTTEDKQGLSQMAETYKRTKSTEKHAALLTFFSESSKVKIPAVWEQMNMLRCMCDVTRKDRVRNAHVCGSLRVRDIADKLQESRLRCKYIRQLLKSDSTGKFLVFAHHRNMIEAICLTLDELGVHYMSIVGSTPPSARADLVDKFQYRESCRVAVLSITAANSGLTLTAASLVLFTELHWNPGILSQAEARAHRIGQRGRVCVRYLLASGTSDDYMWPMLQGKLNVLNEVGLSKDSFDDTKQVHQESKNNITQYLNASSSKNKSDYIPGTNILKNQTNLEHSNSSIDENKPPNYRVENNLVKEEQLNNQENETNRNHFNTNIDKNKTNTNLSEDNTSNSRVTNGCDAITDDVDKSFLEYDEDDDLLANLDL